jgi:hypothetical protein
MPLLESIGSGAARALGLTSFARRLDAFFNRTTLLVSANGTNASSNTVFTDSSSDNVSLTRLGNTAPGSFSPFLDNYSVYYNGSSYSQVSQNTAFQFGTGQFTIEFWVNAAPDVNIQSYWTSMVSIGGVGYTQRGIAFYLPDGGDSTVVGGLAVDFATQSGGIRMRPSSADLRGTGWRHIALTRDGSNDVRLFLDGQIVATGNTSISIDGSGVYGCVIGISDSGQANFFKGNISNLRVLKGTALYTANFTPPTSKLTAITNTSFLANQSNAWSKDLSSNNLTIFAGGGAPRTSAESPFIRTTSYSISEGASYFFDGSGDSIQLGNNAVQDPAFISWLNTNQARVGTIEAWVYPTSFGNDTTNYEHSSIFNKGHVFWNWGVRGNTIGGGQVGTFRFYWYDGSQKWLNSSSTIKLHEWTHLASVVNGSSVTLYINGVASNGTWWIDGTQQGGSVNFTGIYTPASFALGSEHYMGRTSSELTSSSWNGYISNFRVVSGTQVYTSNFTPPTAPLSNISNTRLLLSGAGTSIIDATRTTNIESFGNPQISTSITKFGTGSIVLDGSGDALIAKGIPPLRDIGTGNFTVEGWYYPTTWTAETIFRRLWAAGTSLANDVSLNINSDGTVMYRNNDSILITSSSVLPLNNWTHVALVRNNGTTTLYFNGIVVGSTATNNNLSSAGSNPMFIGNHPNLTGSFQGYIDDFRVSRFARYTSAFTVPNQEFIAQ